jgi:feruloyl-CoA synthase
LGAPELLNSLAAQVQAIGQALLNRGLGQDDSVAILSGHSIEHAVMMLGAMAVGVPVAPISPGYSLLTRDFAKLRHVIGLLVLFERAASQKAYRCRRLRVIGETWRPPSALA